MQEHADARLARDGDRAAFTRLVLDMETTLYRVSCTLLTREADRADAIQEALVTAWTRIDRLRDPERFRPWLIRILVNECHTLHRRRRREVLQADAGAREAAAGRNDALYEALLSLEEDLRLPVVLHYIEGYTVEETGAMVGVPAGTVKSRLSRARARLRAQLEGGMEIGYARV